MKIIKNKSKWYRVGVIILVTLFFSTTLSVSVNAKSQKNQEQNIIFIMKPKNETNLKKFVYSSVNQNSNNYHKYLSPQKFATKYGQSKKNTTSFTKYLNKNKIKSKVYSGNLIVSATGKTKDIEKAFKIKVNKKNNLNQSLTVPKKYSKIILDNTGISKSREFSDNLNQKSVSNGFNSKDDSKKFINNYKLNKLFENNKYGQEQNIGIISFANFNLNDINTFWNKENVPSSNKRVKTYKNNFGSNSWNGYEETTMDIQQAGAVAPGANINVYLSDPNTKGMIINLANAISQNKVDTLSISWGKSEKLVADDIKRGSTPKRYSKIINLLMLQAASQGITIFAASGDSGAYDSINETGSGDLSVDIPSSSPYLTSTGGTTLPTNFKYKNTTINVPNERAWSSNYLYKAYNKENILSRSEWITKYFAGSGGGFSSYNSTTPKYQNNVSGINTFNAIKMWDFGGGYINQRMSYKHLNGTGNGRNVPDISAAADPYTGYNIYYSNPNSKKGGKWKNSVGGTSIVAPQMAAAAAVLNSSHNTRLGFWNPQIYKFANSSNSPFKVLDNEVSNTNNYYTGQKGKYYNQATGLGTVDFSKLNNMFKK
ncbi:protease pro-enzyme activation domain-containing protein [Lactobacillus sp. S2-2]|uniref:S53 family peptidase n=1 Tax=Lactobacillus sp. S2-2 TaxID=2692917 RepID=UPI001F2370C4|nr:S53 family peptidase [Lactobacillus sp. S2-2]